MPKLSVILALFLASCSAEGPPSPPVHYVSAGQVAQAYCSAYCQCAGDPQAYGHCNKQCTEGYCTGRDCALAPVLGDEGVAECLDQIQECDSSAVLSDTCENF